jgi:uncharacterized membrane protein
MLILSIQLLLDYLLTYIGVQFGVITEGNPLMAWLFNMPIIQGLFIRICMIALLIVPFVLLKYLKYKHLQKLLIAINAAYFLVFIAHFYWISQI